VELRDGYSMTIAGGPQTQTGRSLDEAGTVWIFSGLADLQPKISPTKW
jgi:hypothetical protein